MTELLGYDYDYDTMLNIPLIIHIPGLEMCIRDRPGGFPPTADDGVYADHRSGQPGEEKVNDRADDPV